ncbi:MAG TPA: tetratricopeptide repeat protein [Caldimonas sp.]|nr:tetratricopeptide repeat protein [Caldimonas sp.]
MESHKVLGQWPMVALLLAGLVCAGDAAAQLISGYPPNVDAFDPREVALLPRYCIYTQTFRDRVPGGADPVMIERWYADLGQTFHAMHHYCYGLMKTNRAVLLARDPSVKQFYLADAVTEFDYVIERAPPDFVLLPEMLTKKGENLVLLGKAPLAVLAFEQAIEKKKDYWIAYARLSDYYKETGDLRKARETLERGLAAAPDAKLLERRLAELGTAPERRSVKR